MRITLTISKTPRWGVTDTFLDKCICLTCRALWVQCSNHSHKLPGDAHFHQIFHYTWSELFSRLLCSMGYSWWHNVSPTHRPDALHPTTFKALERNTQKTFTTNTLAMFGCPRFVTFGYLVVSKSLSLSQCNIPLSWGKTKDPVIVQSDGLDVSAVPMVLSLK